MFSIKVKPGHDKLLRLPEVLERVPVSKSAWWAGTKNGTYPAAIKLSPRVAVWRESDIDMLVAGMRAEFEYGA